MLQKRLWKILALAGLAAINLCTSPSFAVISTEPLLTRTASVEPNIVINLDDSGSMYYGILYEYGGVADYRGRPGPSTQTFAGYSPSVNKIYYDPRILYARRINADGTLQAGGPTNAYVINQLCDPQAGGSACFQANAPEQSTSGTYTIKVYFAKPFGVAGTGFGVADVGIAVSNTSYSTTSVNAIGAYYNPSYTPSAAELAPGATVLAYPNTNTGGTATLPKWTARTDCVASTTSCSWNEERQNYGNWLTYHSNRMRMAKTGIGLAFQTLGPSFRLGWGVMSDLSSNKRLISGVQLYDTTVRSNFLTWLYGFDNSSTPSATPTLQSVDAVGVYFTRRDNAGPWATSPTSSSVATSTTNRSATSSATAVNTHSTCRRSYQLLMTDGYYNAPSWAAISGSPLPSGAPGNVDGNAKSAIPRPIGATYAYTPVRPYTDAFSDTFGDLAFKYWVTDLRPDLDNNVKPVTGARPNESYWQNMSFYAIGLGLSGTLPQTPATQAALTAGPTTNWPLPIGNTPTAIDDMWHATINGRGQLLSATNADSLKASIGQMMADVDKQSSSQSGVAVSTANLISGTRKYTPDYSTGVWTGNITARNLDPNTGRETTTAWQVETSETVSTIPAHASRNLVVWDGAGASPKAPLFTFTAMPTTVKASMTGTVTTELIDYLRGDRSNEGTKGLGLYRSRERTLGDIVNSAPAFVKAGVDMGYGLLGGTGATAATAYAGYRSSKVARSQGVLFVGANDGILHAFRESDGVEVFGFVPRAVLPKINALADKAYTHQYFVDGPTVEADAYLGGTWKNLVVGTAGAGAKSVFAINVDKTTPTALSGSDVMWEINSSTTGFTELGHVLTDVQTGQLTDGTWVAVFGNGYESAAGTARLYVVNLQTGALLMDITVPGASNGLGGVRLAIDDTVGSTTRKQIMGAYAGDLLGKMWKFDLKDASACTTPCSSKRPTNPLFTTSPAQPITATPAVLKHPTLGKVVSFGTGKFYETSDLSTTERQTMYGVWDNVDFGGTPTVTNVTGTATLMVEQTIGDVTATRVITNPDLTTSTVVVTYFGISTNAVDWATKRGWYTSFPTANTGQRNVYPTEILIGNFIQMDTISPSNVSLDPCLNTGKGKGWVYVFDGLTGKGLTEQVFDTNGDGNVDSADTIVSGFASQPDGRNTSLVIASRTDASQTTLANISGGDSSSTIMKFSCGLLGNCPAGAQQQRRTWRQLFMR